MFTTDGQLVGGKFKVLTDPKHLFGFQNVAPVVTKSLASREGPAFDRNGQQGLKAAHVQAMQQMNKAVTIEKQSPGAVARQFLQANGLA